jgi:hypothetical protein
VFILIGINGINNFGDDFFKPSSKIADIKRCSYSFGNSVLLILKVVLAVLEVVFR